MKEFLRKHGKLVHMTYLVLAFVVVLSALTFMTQYRNVRVNYSEQDGLGPSVECNKAGQQTLYELFKMEYTDRTGTQNKKYASDFPEELKTENGFADQAQFVFDSRQDMDDFNDLILTFGVICILAIVVLFIFSNNSRRIYYKSNLIVGTLVPILITTLMIILIAKDLGLMSTFNDNFDLFNLVSVAQNPLNSNVAGKSIEWSQIRALYDCDATTFIVYMCFYGVVILYSIFMFIYTIFRYKDCAVRRGQILEMVGSNND